MKLCSKCGIEKPLTDFRRDDHGRGSKANVYYRPECKECEIKLRLQLAQAKKNATPQPLRCECCGKEAKLVVDHDHHTGEFRGWLCQRCNKGMGMLGDDIYGLKQAIKYLKKPYWIINFLMRNLK